MKKLLINGGNKINGSVQISGAKNAALPLMVATILTDEKLTLSNLPQVADISTMVNLLSNLGIDFNINGMDENDGHLGKTITFDASHLNNPIAPYNLVCKMRASILILGPLLARFGKAKVSLPGGCAIGTRPVDLHLDALKKMGATIKIIGGYIEGSVKNKLKGANIHFKKTSVGATENIVMAATLAKGKTIIHNASREPEIVDLVKCLKKMGADISGEGSSIITIVGVDRLHQAKHKIIADRIEAGTYIVAAAITDGCLQLSNINTDLLIGFKDKLEKAGISIITIDNNTIEVKRSQKYLNAIDISTQPHPGFPTDMQAQFMSLMCVAKGTSTISENIFENRFMHILELVRMGANIESHSNVAIVKGTKKLFGAEVMATDLRASVSLVLAGLAAKGQTIINRLYHLERGYERLTEKLIACGANIKMIY